ncbi:hypothetical protein [Prosthecomicrobium pneumaticum]|uniref:Uncharacterized protein n=1 Tax=Prosthecomicrobium pneumaticum TaxID=81895 RepID=A0A7W9CU53_9HYPH|nr:hypothetical protein [Prosthecomicrobium pneumaticum]MBB5751689.1 hypothetical protein [Prosthecomicrobium pneumaticum]
MGEGVARRKLSGDDLAAMETLYRDGVSIYVIADRFRIQHSTVGYHARTKGWRRTARVHVTRATERSVPVRPRSQRRETRRVRIVRRMITAFERQIAALEARFGEGAGAALDEPGVKMLGALAKTFETLIALDRAAREAPRRGGRTGEAAAGDPDDRTAEGAGGDAGDRDRLRAEIADRLSKLIG